MRHLLHDLRLAGRRLRRAPGFAVLASVTLALGVGAHAALAGWADATFLRPLPVPEPDRLAGIYETRDGAGYHPLSLPDFVDYRAGTEVFASLAAHYPVAPLVLDLPGGDGSGEEILGSVVSPGYFAVLGVEPARGRFFTPDEEGPPGAHPVAVVSHRFWRERLGGGDGVLGGLLRLNDTAFTVVGVAPASFRGVRLGEEPAIWIPTSMASVGYRWCDPTERDCTFVEMIGRLAVGRTLGEARAEMTVLSRRLRAAHPRGEPGRDGSQPGLAVEPLLGIHPALRSRALRLGALLGFSATLVLLVAATNLGGLLVARDVTRRRETATRLAIGARPWRIAREAVAEMVILAGASCVGALLVAAWLGRAVVALLPGAGPLGAADAPTVIAWTSLLCLAVGIVVGLATGLRSSLADPVIDLSGSPPPGSGGLPRSLALLLASQLALSFVLLTSALLLVTSLRHAESMSAAAPERVATLRLRPRLIDAEPERARAFTREAIHRLESLPGVERVTAGRLLPPWSGLDAPPAEPAVLEIGPGFFETFGFPLLAGRAIEPQDETGPPVAVVGRALAEARWGGPNPVDPVGELLTVGERSYRVVGVVDDTVYRSATQAAPPSVYTAFWRDPSMVDARVAVRTTGDAEELLGVLGRTVRSVDPAVPVTEIETLADRVGRLLGPTRAAERLVGASALVTVLLSAIGLYGLLSLVVSRGRREIGIRLALGGSRARVTGEAIRGGLTVTAVALAIGLGAALLAGRGLAHHLYEIEPRDPATLAAAVALFALVAAAAAWWPARRAARVDPAVTLRQG